MTFCVQSAERSGQGWLDSSQDLHAWGFVRVLYEDPDPDVTMIECPDLFPLGEEWVLLEEAEAYEVELAPTPTRGRS